MSRRPPPPPAGRPVPAPPPDDEPSDDGSVPPSSDEGSAPPPDDEDEFDEEGSFDGNDEGSVPPPDSDEDEGSLPGSTEPRETEFEEFDDDIIETEEGDFDEEGPEGSEEPVDSDGDPESGSEDPDGPMDDDEDFGDDGPDDFPEDGPEEESIEGSDPEEEGEEDGSEAPEDEDEFDEEPEESVGEPDSDAEFSQEPTSENEDSDIEGSDEPEDEEDVDTEPEDLPPPPKGKSGAFVLPVRTANKKSHHEDIESVVSGASLGAGLNLDSLSSGLKIKQPPKLLSKPADVPPPPAPPTRAAPRLSTGPTTAATGTRIDTNRGSLNAALNARTSSTAGTDFNNTTDKNQASAAAADAGSVSTIGMTSAVGAGADAGNSGTSAAGSVVAELVLRDPAEVRVEALANGYIEAQGKFEGDEFETLYVQIDTAKSLMRVLVAQGLPVEFDLSNKAFVFEDTADPTSIILDYRGNIVVFKFNSVDALLENMKKLPSAVFMVADLTEEERKKIEEEARTKRAPPVAPKKVGKYDASHIKGMSVEDLLEEDYQTVDISGQDQLDRMFSGNIAMGSGVGSGANRSGAANGEAGPPPRRRAELADSYIRKPQYSVRRVTLLCEWINSLHIWPNMVSIPTLHREMCNGLLLARVVKTVNPSATYVNLNEKALSKKAAMENLEQALGNIWRSKSLNNSRIPTANEIYVGNTSKTAILLNELFGAYVQKPLYKNSMRVLKWYHAILRQYNRPLPASTFDQGDLSTVWPHFQSGTALFCVIYHLFGPNLVGSSDTGRVRVDPLRVAGNPTSICDYRNNLFYVFTLLEALCVDVIWTPEDWISNPDTEFIMLQLSYIYEAFKHKQSALPPAQGSTAGMTSGPNGEPLVVGIIYQDSRPANARLTTAVRKAVLLGHDSDSMPLLPVDRAGKAGRFISSVCPRGMVSNNAQLKQISVALRENRLHKERTSWNQSNAVYKEAKESAKGSEVVALLREHNKRSTVDGSSTLTALAAVPTTALVPGPGPGTLASGKLIQAEYKPLPPSHTVDGGRVHSAALRKITSDSALVESVSSKGQEIELAVQNLEDEMLSSQQQLTVLEDNLANRYLDLEASAAHISGDEYETIFEGLEAERRELSDEKLKLQTHFARKLESIKDIYSEAEQRVRVNQVQQQSTMRVTHKGVTTTVVGPPGGAGGAGSPTKRNPAGITAKSTPGKTLKNGTTAPGLNGTAKVNPAQHKALSEKGWVSQLKPTAHNYHLKNLQNASVAAVEACWTPKYVKAKEAQRRQQQGQGEQHLADENNASFEAQHRTQLFASSGGGAQLGLSQEEQVERSFNRFKKRLHQTSLRWVELKTGVVARNNSVHDIMNASSGGPSTAALVSLPSKSLTADRDLSHDQREELQRLARTIREEEAARMQYEDQRRRLLLEQTGGDRGGNGSGKSHYGAVQGSQGANNVPFSSSASVASGNSNLRANVNNTSNPKLVQGGVANASGVWSSHSQQVNSIGASAGAGHYSTDYFFDTPVNIGLSASRGANGKGGMSHLTKKPTQPEVDAAFKWLCIPRALVIAERTPKEYVFAVVVAGSEEASQSYGESKSSATKNQKSFVFEWREGALRGGSVPDVLAGCVYVSEIRDISGPTGDMDTFTLVIGSSTKALRNSKGRTTVAVKCSSPGECAKYLASLRCLRRSYED